jgi:hypothetical protein
MQLSTDCRRSVSRQLESAARRWCLAGVLAVAPAAQASTIVYFNRCAAGCQFVAGVDDSVLNTSTVLSGTHNLGAFVYGDAVFNAVVACATQLLRPFDIVVTTSDPSPQPHSELVLAGTAAQGGFDVGVGGVAPATCGYVAGAPAFLFANSYGSDVNGLCWSSALLLGSMAGLEPLYNCPDVMSYLTGCGSKSFRNEESPCGTFAPEPCLCGGSSRNSFQTMRSVVGAADPVFASGFE